MRISLIFAVDDNNAIGFQNRLPWHLPADLKRFKSTTMGHCIIMGRNTAESIGKSLQGRTSIVITHNADFKIPDMITVASLPEALRVAEEAGETEAFVIGGATLFTEAIPLASKYYLTVIKHIFGADTYLPAIDWTEWNILYEQEFPIDKNNAFRYIFYELERKSLQTDSDLSN